MKSTTTTTMRSTTAPSMIPTNGTDTASTVISGAPPVIRGQLRLLKLITSSLLVGVVLVGSVIEEMSAGSEEEEEEEVGMEGEGQSMLGHWQRSRGISVVGRTGMITGSVTSTYQSDHMIRYSGEGYQSTDLDSESSLGLFHSHLQYHIVHRECGVLGDGLVVE